MRNKEKAMKYSKSLLLLPLAFACLLLSTTAARADILVSLDSPYQVGNSNQYTFTGTLTNSDPSATVFLNGDFFLLDSPLTFNDSVFNANVPEYLDPFASSSDIELFTIYLPEGTPIGLYTGTYLLLGGADGDAQDVVGSANFDVQATPEPSSLVLLATGLVGVAGAFRRKMTR